MLPEPDNSFLPNQPKKFGRCFKTNFGRRQDLGKTFMSLNSAASVLSSAAKIFRPLGNAEQWFNFILSGKSWRIGIKTLLLHGQVAYRALVLLDLLVGEVGHLLEGVHRYQHRSCRTKNEMRYF
jgi:hypothetical protein